jgi:hypothetical protein
MGEVSNSETPLGASFRIRLDGELVAIATVGQAYRFITSLSMVEWMEFESLYDNAKLRCGSRKCCVKRTGYECSALYSCAQSFSDRHVAGRPYRIVERVSGLTGIRGVHSTVRPARLSYAALFLRALSCFAESRRLDSCGPGDHLRSSAESALECRLR